MKRSISLTGVFVVITSIAAMTAKALAEVSGNLSDAVSNSVVGSVLDTAGSSINWINFDGVDTNVAAESDQKTQLAPKEQPAPVSSKEIDSKVQVALP